jgi:hypothetical protein
MGCYNYTCCVSGLPIMGDHKVRYFLLTESPSNQASRPIHIYDAWYPRTFPLKAKYNDYGTVENVEAGPMQDIWMEAFQRDIRPLGGGDNHVHDLPVYPEMSFEELLKALRSNRVQSLRRMLKVSADGVAAFREKLPACVPTMERVRAHLKSSPKAKPHGEKGFVVDELENGVVRVRWHNDRTNSSKPLVRAQKRLGPHFATVLTVGSGNYPERTELRVFAKPGPENVVFYKGATEDEFLADRPLMVAQAMIREDVWQALLKETISDGWSDKPGPSLAEFKTSVRGAYKKVQALLERNAKVDKQKPTAATVRRMLAVVRQQLDEMNKPVHPALWAITREELPYMVGLSHHWHLFAKNRLSVKEAAPFLDTVAETAYVTLVLMGVRHVWHPSPSTGAQVGEFDKHLSYHSAMAQICKDRLREMSEDE